VKTFDYLAPTDVSEALQAITTRPGARFLGGGTNLVDLVREGIEAPDTMIDVTRLGLDTVEEPPGGGLRIGAGVRNSHLAEHSLVRTRFPVVTQALLSGASGQLRNLATVGGNLLQRTRCLYFYDGAAACNKREPGAGCAAVGGFNRMGAVLGASEHCVAVHPSDLCVALTALDAEIEVRSARDTRRIPIGEFHRLPGDTPHRETSLAPDELITAVELPELPLAATSCYRKVRDRASYAFALVSVAGALEVRDGVVHGVRLALGGVAHKPWRAHAAEQALVGEPATDEAFRAAAQAELAGAVGASDNQFKIGLAERTIVAVLRRLRDAVGVA
jgi:xanthine dehydrogenase YagS FAD-binding subunit